MTENTTTPSQREVIFHTRCKIMDKVCSVIIDSGSCCNIISQEVVGRFSLSTTPHPLPYPLCWLNSNAPIQVKERARVSFSIGPYKDEVECDVVPMTACHLLLGRPWQFDKGAIHDGISNEYHFQMEGKKVTLHPMSPHEIMLDYAAKEQRKKHVSREVKKDKKLAIGGNVGTSTPLLLAKPKEIAHTFKGSGVCLLLVFHESYLSSQELGDLPPSISLLLQDFEELFQEEVPKGLPPVRGIEHQIDFVPGATLPNRPAYRANPEETKELQRQV
jgi:hypothetical protein